MTKHKSADEFASQSEQLAAWFAGLRYEDLPSDVVDNTRLRILDIIGLSLSGSKLDYGPVAHETALAIGGAPEAHIIGYGDHTGAPSAAITA
jgi:2-methylcitrate dehydratase PrpD